jgi:uncharacterized protein involved in exopolysaccharide biosynthesis
MDNNSTLIKANDITLTGFLNQIKKSWWFFLIVSILFGVAGVLYAHFKKPVYQSKLTFALDDGGSQNELSGARSIASQLGINVGGNANVFADDNIIEIMLSRRIIEKVLTSEEILNNKRYKLVEYYLNESGIRESAPRNSKLKNVHFSVGQDRSSYSYDQDSVLFIAYSDFTNEWISVNRPDKKLNLFQVQVSTFNEKFSKIFTDRLVAETDSFYTDICTKKAKENLAILEQRVEAMRGNLHSSISSKAFSTDANLNPAFSETTIPLQKEQVNIEVYGESYAEMFKNLEIAWFQYLKKIPLMQIIDHADYPMLRIKTSRILAGIIFAFVGMFLLTIIILIKIIFGRESKSYAS